MPFINNLFNELGVYIIYYLLLMFYTNVQPHGNFIALRGVDEHGESFQKKVRYEPTLYVHSQNPSKWKTLDGKKVSPVKWGSMKESYQAIKNYAGDVFGIDQFQYAFIADQYPGMISYDVSKMKIAYMIPKIFPITG